MHGHLVEEQYQRLPFLQPLKKQASRPRRCLELEKKGEDCEEKVDTGLRKKTWKAVRGVFGKKKGGEEW